MKRKLISVIVAVGLLASHTFSYGPQGHSLVGAIADRRLAKANQTVAAKVSKTLGGLSLSDAALLPDEIKTWDAAKDSHKLTPIPQLKAHPKNRG